jgi:excisionase family DNA binding protein
MILKRLLTIAEAAEYLGVGREFVLDRCPVKPLRIRPGQRGLRYDVRALDAWIDTLSDTNQASGRSASDWLGKLDGDNADQRR